MTDDFTGKYSNSITDSVIAVNQLVLGNAASSAMASMYVAMSHAAGIGAQNSVSAQQQLNILGAAAVAAGTGTILWDGLSRQVDDMTINDRMKYWQQMKAVALDQAPNNGSGNNAAVKDTAANSEGSAVTPESKTGDTGTKQETSGTDSASTTTEGKT